MADEQTPTPETKVDPQPATLAPAEAAPALPESFQLTELEQLRLAASNEHLRRLSAELQMAQMQMMQIKQRSEQLQQDLQNASVTQGELLNAVGETYKVGAAVRRYDINIQTGLCTLRKPNPPKG